MHAEQVLNARRRCSYARHMGKAMATRRVADALCSALPPKPRARHCSWEGSKPALKAAASHPGCGKLLVGEQPGKAGVFLKVPA